MDNDLTRHEYAGGIYGLNCSRPAMTDRALARCSTPQFETILEKLRASQPAILNHRGCKCFPDGKDKF